MLHTVRQQSEECSDHKIRHTHWETQKKTNIKEWSSETENVNTKERIREKKIACRCQNK